jgi:hypothetical protein
MVSSDANTKDVINKKKIHIECDDKVVKNELEYLFFNILGMNTRLKGIIKGFTTKGNHPMEILVDSEDKGKGIQGLRKINVESYWRIENSSGKVIRFEEKIPGLNSGCIVYDPAQVVDFEMRDDSSDFVPYGEPLIEGARKAWKQLSLMEAALLIYRIERAPERRVFYIDVGNMTQVEAEVVTDMAKAKFKKKKYYNANTGEVDEKYSPLEVSEDFFMPLTASAPNSKIDTVQGGMNIGEIDDLQIFKQNMLAPLNIPLSYMSDQFQPGVSKASLAQEDINYARTVEAVQDMAVQGLYKLAIIHLMLKGYSIVETVAFKINLTSPSDIAEIIKMDVENKKMEIVSNAINLGLSRREAFKRYMNFTEEDFDLDFKQGLEEMFKIARAQQGEDPNRDPNEDTNDENLQFSDNFNALEENEEDNSVIILENLLTNNQLSGFDSLGKRK